MTDDDMTDDQEEPAFDLSALVAQAQAMQQQLVDAQARLADEIVEGHSGGGVVKVQVTGNLDFRAVTIDPKAVDPDDVEMLQDLVLAAVRDAVARVNELSQEAMGGFGGLLRP